MKNNTKSVVEYLDIEQNTDDWFECRMGIPTASNMGKIITPSTFKPSASRSAYIGEILSHGLEDNDNSFYSDDMQEGHRREHEALADYSLLTGNKTHLCGIIYQDASLSVSCSPDALVGDDGGVECKNPLLKTHIKYMIDDVIPTIYKPQVYASLVISGREWWDFVSYHPKARSFIKRATRKDMIKTGKTERLIVDLVAEQIDSFLDDLEKTKQKVFY